ncbi:hypothetical protein ACLJJ6_03970 [Pediococcus siamensis]|uniref:hypothetical protein n=1 Tax=Pediococcus siamensis TaxID=381829 RepID=UPI0039A0BA65
MKATDLKKLELAVAQKQWQQVLNLIEPYEAETQDDRQLNYYYVLSLYQTKHYVEGLKFARDSFAFYLENDKMQNLYFSLLVGCQNFLDAHKFLVTLERLGATNLANYQERLQEKEAEAFEMTATLKQKQKKFYHLGDLTIPEAYSTLEEAKQLPADAYFQAAQFIFVDPFVHPLVRATILENVTFLARQEEINYYWLDEQNHRVLLKGLPEILANKAQKNLTNYLTEKLADQDPILLDGILKEKNLFLSYLYPFADQIITKPQVWADYWIAEYRGQAHPLTDQTQKIASWQAKFHKYTAQLLENN